MSDLSLETKLRQAVDTSYPMGCCDCDTCVDDLVQAILAVVKSDSPGSPHSEDT